MKEGSLLFVDELHQDSRLVVGDVSHVIPPAQKKPHSVCPKTFQTFMTGGSSAIPEPHFTNYGLAVFQKAKRFFLQSRNGNKMQYSST